VGDKLAIAIKVSHRDRKDVILQFEKGPSPFLIKSEMKIWLRPRDTNQINQETLYSDYQEIEGAKIATKVTRFWGGKKEREGNRFEFKTVGKHHEKVFIKP
jgi:hypothetical protein